MLGGLARARACVFFEAGGEGGSGGGGLSDKKSCGVMAVDGGRQLSSAKWQQRVQLARLSAAK